MPLVFIRWPRLYKIISFTPTQTTPPLLIGSIMQSPYWDKNQTSEFIRIMRPILILLVCAVHIPFIAGYTANVTPAEAPQMLLGVYIKDVLARSAVPLLSVISGYLAFYSYKKYGYTAFLKNKTKKLLTPFLATNLATLAFFYAMQTLANTHIVAMQDITDVTSALGAITGINHRPINFPLYFLRDLFVICCGIIFIDLIARKRLVFFSAFTLIFFFNIKHSGLSINIGENSIFIIYRLEMVLFFLLGYAFSSADINPKKTESYTAFTALMLYGFILLSVAVIISATKPSMMQYLDYRKAIGFTSILFIPAFMAIAHSAKNNIFHKLLLRISPYSFMIFLTHIIFSIIFMELKNHLGFIINLTSPLHIQLMFFATYLAGCTIFAICIHKALEAAKRRLALCQGIWNT